MTEEDAWQTVAKYGSSDLPSDIGSVQDYNGLYINSDEGCRDGKRNTKKIVQQKRRRIGQIYQEFLNRRNIYVSQCIKLAKSI